MRAADVPYAALFEGSAPVQPIDDAAVAELLRCSMGLSAWKQYRQSRWALRVNPSSGNLHPTEAYLVRDGHILHYAPREHALELRGRVDDAAWSAFTGSHAGFLVALTSIHWREAWKYGERAFRYCQHDVGHAIAALRLAAALLGWRMMLLPRWSDEQIAGVLGLDREADFAGAEHEEPECLAVVTPDAVEWWLNAPPDELVAAARTGEWTGRANALSPAHVEWPIIDEVASATRYRADAAGSGHQAGAGSRLSRLRKAALDSTRTVQESPPARRIVLQRRSAVAFDARSTLPRDRFVSMLARTLPHGAPWDALGWEAHIHLLLFVHRVERLTPGVYAYLRDPGVRPHLQAAMRREFLWEPVNDPNDPNLFLLLPFDVTWVATRVSCDQDIAGDGFFSLAMLAPLESALGERGEWFYRRLFWECGMLGQVLYLEAEAAGARATGIGCFYDDAVHEAAGLSGLTWQSLYHLAMGGPVDDDRLTTEPGYPWDWEPSSTST